MHLSIECDSPRRMRATLWNRNGGLESNRPAGGIESISRDFVAARVSKHTVKTLPGTQISRRARPCRLPGGLRVEMAEPAKMHLNARYGNIGHS
jgi:hypothetical protein